MRLVPLLILLLVAAIAVAAWAWPNRPREVGVHDKPLASVSFAPFRKGQSPLARIYPTVSQIDEDLAVLSGAVGGVRTYTSLEGMEAVPRLAARHRLQVTHGAWLSPRLAINEQEVVALIAAANRYPDSITRVIVGNEVLLRGELTAKALGAYIRRVRQAIRQPVSYADVWEYWLRNPELAAEVDFITIHILPYWEDHPVHVERVAEHILAVYNRVKQRFPDKPVMIGETGWPSAGRSREEAAPGRVNAVRFLHQFLDLAAREGFDYNVIEAFDQPWKSAQEGTVGANWGLYDADRRRKYDLAAPTAVENPDWPWQAAAAVLIGIAAGLSWLRRRPQATPRAVLGYAVLAQLSAGAVVFAAAQGYAQSYGTATSTWTTVKVMLQAGLAAVIITVAGRLLAARPASVPRVGLGEALVRDGSLAAVGSALVVTFSLVAIALSLALVIDPRYRDFPSRDFVIPVAALYLFKVMEWLNRGQAPLTIGRLLVTDGPHPPSPVSDRRLAIATLCCMILLIGSAAGITFREGVMNREAMVWAAMLLALSVPWSATALAALRRCRQPAPPGPAGTSPSGTSDGHKLSR